MKRWGIAAITGLGLVAVLVVYILTQPGLRSTFDTRGTTENAESHLLNCPQDEVRLATIKDGGSVCLATLNRMTGVFASSMSQYAGQSGAGYNSQPLGIVQLAMAEQALDTLDREPEPDRTFYHFRERIYVAYWDKDGLRIYDFPKANLPGPVHVLMGLIRVDDWWQSHP